MLSVQGIAAVIRLPLPPVENGHAAVVRAHPDAALPVLRNAGEILSFGKAGIIIHVEPRLLVRPVADLKAVNAFPLPHGPYSSILRHQSTADEAHRAFRQLFRDLDRFDFSCGPSPQQGENQCECSYEMFEFN